MLIFPYGNKFIGVNLEIRNAKDVGQLVKTTRKKLKVTQRSLALTSGTGLRFIIELEQGKPSCQLEKVLMVLSTLGVTLVVKGK